MYRPAIGVATPSVANQEHSPGTSDAWRGNRLSRRRLLAGAAATASSSLVALGTPSWLSGIQAAEAQPVRGGTLRATLGAEPDTLDPHTGNSLFDQDLADALFDALIDNDTLSGVRGALAQSWNSPDAVVWTFKLQRNAKFHDGASVTSDAVRASMERISNSATGASKAYTVTTDRIISIDTPDPLTIVFRLNAPDAVFPLQVADLKIVPRGFDPTKPVGAGPFQFEEWVRNQRIRVRRFPAYYRNGTPLLDEVIFLPTPDENQKIVLLQTGQVDFTDTIPLPRAQEVQKSGNIQVLGIPEGVSPSSYFMLTNTRTAPLDNPKVRQAMNYAIDRRSVIEATFGFGTIKSNLVPPKHWAFNPGATSYNVRNLAKARQLMQEAGLSNGFAVQLKYITSRAEFASIAQLFQANMGEIGIKVDLLPQEIGVWIDQVLVKYDFQLGLTGLTPRADPDFMLSQFDPNNQNGAAIAWSNAEYEQLLARGRAVADQAQRKQIYFRLQEIGQDACPGFVINERPILYGGSLAVQGFRPDIQQHSRFASVWLKK